MVVPVIPLAVAFVCTPIAVWDGDGPIWCREGVHVRIAGIAAREHDGSCRGNQLCPAASANSARDALVRLLGRANGQRSSGHVRVIAHGPMRCVSTGSARGNRTGAWCRLPDGRDLSCAMIATGTVLRWQRYWADHRCP